MASKNDKRNMAELNFFGSEKIICRGCLGTKGSMEEAKLFEELFRHLTGIIISPTDRLPQWFCYKCAALLRKFAQFRRKMMNSHHFICRKLFKGVSFEDKMNEDSDHEDEFGDTLEDNIDMSFTTNEDSVQAIQKQNANILSSSSTGVNANEVNITNVGEVTGANANEINITNVGKVEDKEIKDQQIIKVKTDAENIGVSDSNIGNGNVQAVMISNTPGEDIDILETRFRGVETVNKEVKDQITEVEMAAENIGMTRIRKRSEELKDVIISNIPGENIVMLETCSINTHNVGILEEIIVSGHNDQEFRDGYEIEVESELLKSELVKKNYDEIIVPEKMYEDANMGTENAYHTTSVTNFGSLEYTDTNDITPLQEIDDVFLEENYNDDFPFSRTVSPTFVPLNLFRAPSTCSYESAIFDNVDTEALPITQKDFSFKQELISGSQDDNNAIEYSLEEQVINSGDLENTFAVNYEISQVPDTSMALQLVRLGIESVDNYSGITPVDTEAPPVLLNDLSIKQELISACHDDNNAVDYSLEEQDINAGDLENTFAVNYDISQVPDTSMALQLVRLGIESVDNYSGITPVDTASPPITQNDFSIKQELISATHDDNNVVEYSLEEQVINAGDLANTFAVNNDISQVPDTSMALQLVPLGIESGDNYSGIVPVQINLAVSESDAEFQEDHINNNYIILNENIMLQDAGELHNNDANDMQTDINNMENNNLYPDVTDSTAVVIKKKKFKTKIIANKDKAHRVSGKDKVGKPKRKKRARTLKDGCKCRKYRCDEKFSAERRREIFDNFWKIGDHTKRWHYILKHVTTEEVRTITIGRHFNRMRNIIYFFPLTKDCNTLTAVCKIFFLNTLSVSDRYVYTALQKSKDKEMKDRRGGDQCSRRSQERIANERLSNLLTQKRFASEKIFRYKYKN